MFVYNDYSIVYNIMYCYEYLRMIKIPEKTVCLEGSLCMPGINIIRKDETNRFQEQ